MKSTIRLGQIPAARDLQHVEAELGSEMSGRIILIRHAIAELRSDLGIRQRHCEVDRARVPDVVSV